VAAAESVKEDDRSALPGAGLVHEKRHVVLPGRWCGRQSASTRLAADTTASSAEPPPQGVNEHTQKEAVKREFDKFSLRELTRICSKGHAHVIGFHPEGKRNLNGDPYSFLPAQLGIGKVIFAARPQVIPVFIAGLGNDLPKQILGNWRGGEKIRIWFGEPLDLNKFYERSDRLRTHKEIADHLMKKIGELGEADRKQFNYPRSTRDDGPVNP